jgi:hypothetical protein
MGEGVASVAAVDRRAVFRAAALWLAFLAPFFYLTYGFSNWLAAQRADVPNLAFGWEQHIPFLAWTILPYWSINAFYALSLFVNDTPTEVGRLARRYLTAQVVAVLCFIAFPLAGDLRAAGDAWAARLHVRRAGRLRQAVQPGAVAAYRAARHHLGTLARAAARQAMLALWHVWSLLIGASVLTTWQHHTIDIPTGALLGLFALWLFPAGKTLAARRLPPARRMRRRGGSRPITPPAPPPSCLFAVLATLDSGAGLLLLWPFTCTRHRRARFCRRRCRMSSRSDRWPRQPCEPLAAVTLPARRTRKCPVVDATPSGDAVEIADGVFLGRVPSRDAHSRPMPPSST